MKRGEGVCQDAHDELEGRPVPRGCWSCYIAELVTALREIAHHKHVAYDGHGETGQYGIGVTDGHRCAAQIARAALGEEGDHDRR